ncbi:methionyl-tRNA formyltransferase [Janibacter sp. Soil728]|uniref:methionyl-tRNA formyltransferase n=1 Tax=Janibacter sp. Soil728 TaxID=1736393 RepID=UPI0007009FA2|nr:methionyl-tRNA formyltransferase [Janibacter sp. Soil728]KRE37193.1 methionyl-tRNA formyltransferase [Janibacter sp. Soil728]
MRLIFAGTPQVAVPSLRALLDSDHEVIGVITRPDAKVGRGRRLEPSPVKVVAQEAGLEVLAPSSPKDPQFLGRLRELAPDCCPVVAYGALLPAEALDIPAHGWVNLHFSLLPAWRGAAPAQRALMSGDEFTGASTFLIETGLDTGPVLGTMTERIRPDDTSGTLLTRLADAGAPLLVATMDGIATGDLEPRPQPGEGVSHAAKITVEDAHVDLAHPALAVDRLIRGCSPAPGAWTTFRGERLKLGPVTITDERLPAGKIDARKREVLVGTADRAVRLGEVTPLGKKPMPAADWARGVRIDSGDRLGEETA